MAQIIVERTAGSLADRYRKYKVVIDGKVRGHISSGQTSVFDVDMGIHTVKFRVDPYSSPPVKVAVLGATRLLCSSGIAHAFGLMAFLSPSSWIQVREEDDVAAPAPLEVYAGRAELVA